MIRSVGGVSPRIHPDAFVASSADVIGNVTIGKHSSVWYGAVLRGDINAIRIGERTNIQDSCVLHVRTDAPVILGSDITVGHGAIIHACNVADFCLIGMGAIVLDNARVKPYTLVAAGAVVLNDSEFPEGVLITGVPAKVARQLRPDERKMLEESARHYVEYAKMHRE